MNHIGCFVVVGCFSLLAAMSIIALPGIAMAKGTTGGYQSGYNHGVSDAHTSDTRDWYILQPGKGFAFHTHDFIAGCIDGFCSIAGSHMSSDSDKAMWDCARGSDSASWIGDGN